MSKNTVTPATPGPENSPPVPSAGRRRPSRQGARRVWLALGLCLLLGPAMGLHAYRLQTREQLWNLHHLHLNGNSVDIAENIHWLEEALRADFNNPLNALCVIHDKTEWEKYRILFTMHLDLKLVELYLMWGSQFNKQEAYFFNAPWRDLNLESLDKAEKVFRYALVFWDEARKHAKLAADPKFRWTELPGIQAWADESFRIATGELDYQAIIERHLGKLATVRQTFRNMDKSTY